DYDSWHVFPHGPHTTRSQQRQPPPHPSSALASGHPPGRSRIPYTFACEVERASAHCTVGSPATSAGSLSAAIVGATVRRFPIPSSLWLRSMIEATTSGLPGESLAEQIPNGSPARKRVRPAIASAILSRV